MRNGKLGPIDGIISMNLDSTEAFPGQKIFHTQRKWKEMKRKKSESINAEIGCQNGGACAIGGLKATWAAQEELNSSSIGFNEKKRNKKQQKKRSHSKKRESR